MDRHNPLVSRVLVVTYALLIAMAAGHHHAPVHAAGDAPFSGAGGYLAYDCGHDDHCSDSIECSLCHVLLNFHSEYQNAQNTFSPLIESIAAAWHNQACRSTDFLTSKATRAPPFSV